jgi:hypothetical protein
LETLSGFLKKHPQPNPNGLIFYSRHNTPRRENNVLHDGLHPALRAPSLPRAGLHAFRHGRNPKAGVVRFESRRQVKAAFSNVQFSSKSGNKIVVLEMWKMSSKVLWDLERAMESNPRPKLGNSSGLRCRSS